MKCCSETNILKSKFAANSFDEIIFLWESSRVIRYCVSKHNMKQCECGITSSAFCMLPFYVWNVHKGDKIERLWQAPSWFHQVLLVTERQFSELTPTPTPQPYCRIRRFGSCFHHPIVVLAAQSATKLQGLFLQWNLSHLEAHLFGA